MSPPLDRGLYRIIAATQDGKPMPRFVGRSPIEDLSLLPKKVSNLREHIMPVQPWLVEPQDDGNYILRAVGAPVGEKDGALFAFLIQEMAPGTLCWKLKPVESTPNPNDYVVELADDSGKGWTVSDEEDFNGNPILVQPILATKSLPPQFRPTQIFNFLRIDYE